MGDTICTNCRGATTGGCEVCRPGPTNQHKVMGATIGDLASEMAALKLENERLKAAQSGICSVCAGDGRAHRNADCICEGTGTALGELDGLRKYAFELEAKIARSGERDAN